MTTYAAIALATLWSVTFGYEPSADADVGYDYIVQVEPEMLESMQRGKAPEIEANIPPEVAPIRRVRIVVGKEELPKKLRAPLGRTSMRPDIDAGAAATLLAQTGPAGVYGRTPTGFQNAPAGANSPSATGSAAPANDTVPPPSTRYQPFSYTNPASPAATSATGSPAAGQGSPSAAGNAPPGIVDHLGQARDNLRGVTNNLGQAGQQVIDTTREVLGNTIIPPEHTGYDPQGRPLSNLAERLQSEVRNTAEAIRNPWERPATTPTASHVTNPGTTTPSGQLQNQDHWTATSNLPGVVSGAAPSAGTQPTYPPANYANDRYAQEQSVLSQGQGGSATGNIQPPLLEAPSVNSNSGQYAPSQNRNPVDLNQWAGTREEPAPSQPAGNANSQQPIVSLPAGNAWQGNVGNSAAPPQTPQTAQYPAVVSNVSNPAGTSLPEVSSGNRNDEASNTNRRDDVVDFGGNTNGNVIYRDAARAELPATSTGSTMLNVLAWMVAAGSVAGNLFQWGSIVDLRNKYRVALRRNSPGFGRSMAA